MTKLCTYFTLLFIVFAAQPANAESYYERVIREKQQAAEVKRLNSLRKVQEVQSDPNGYFSRKNDVRSAKSSAEKFKVARDGHYYVPVRINNKTLEFMADTGASAIFMSQSDARKVGINPTTLHYNQHYTTANGAKGRAARAVAKKFKVGSIEMTNVPVIVSMENKHIALLGMEFFGRLERYEVSGGEMSLYE